MSGFGYMRATEWLAQDIARQFAPDVKDDPFAVVDLFSALVSNRDIESVSEFESDRALLLELDSLCFKLLDCVGEASSGMRPLVDANIDRAADAPEQISEETGPKITPAVLIGFALLLLMSIETAKIDVAGFKVELQNRPVVGNLFLTIVDRLIADPRVKDLKDKALTLGKADDAPAESKPQNSRPSQN